MASPVALLCSILFCLLLVNAAPKPGKGNGELGPFLQEMKKSQGVCFDYFKSSMKKVLMQALGQLKKSDEESSNSQIRCFITCLLKKSGMVKGDDSDVDVSPILAKMKNPSEEKKEAVTAAADTCKAEAAKGSTACDKGYLFINCLFKKLKEGKTESTDDEDDLDAESASSEEGAEEAPPAEA